MQRGTYAGLAPPRFGGVAAALASGAAIALAQPNWGCWPLAFVCLVPLLRAFSGVSLGRRLALAWLAATFATGLASIVPGIVGARSYFGLSLSGAIATSIGAGQLFGAGSFLLFAALCGDPAGAGPLRSSLRTAAAFAAAEWLRCNAFTGLPWMLLAHSLAPVPCLAASAAFGGVLFVSFWLAAVNALLAQALDPAGRGRAFASLGGLLALVLATAWVARPNDRDASTAPRTAPLRALLVQPGTHLRANESIAELLSATDRLVALSQRAAPETLVVWPENALPAVLPMNDDLVRDALARLGPRAAPVLLGAPRADLANQGSLHTSAFLFPANGRPIAFHDKVHLLPFAEYAPWPLAALWPARFRSTPGATPTVLRSGEIGLGPLVCYEVLFSDLSRALVRDGATVLVNLSNDGWFESTGALEQHLAAAVFRAIETGRPLLRATSTGLTAAIDTDGRILARLPVDVTDALEVEVVPSTRRTPYVVSGNLVGPAALALALGESAAQARRRRRRPVL